MPALGERFRAAREARGLSLSDVSEQIRIRSVYLAAIEDENWTSIGAPVYIRGFLRTYARFLGLDPEEVVATFNGAPAPASAPRGPGASAAEPPSSPPYGTPAPGMAPAAPPPRRAPSFLMWIAGLVAVVLVGFVVYQEVMLHQGRPAEPPAVAASPSVEASESPAPSTNSAAPGSSALPGTVLGLASPGPLASPSPSGSPGDDVDPNGPNTLALTLTAPSWLRVTVDGSVRMEGTFPAGTAKAFRGKSALVRIGNAGGVQILVDGKDVGKIGNSGDVVERTYTL